MQEYTKEEVKGKKTMTKRTVYNRILDRYGDVTGREAREIMDMDYGIVTGTEKYISLTD